jgi:hypothetical protein
LKAVEGGGTFNRGNLPGNLGLDPNVRNAINPTYAGKPLHQGMPPLEFSGSALSFYEF